jgi:hypothetical protein
MCLRMRFCQCLALHFMIIATPVCALESLTVWFLTPVAQKAQRQFDLSRTSKNSVLLSADCELVGSYCLDRQNGELKTSKEFLFSEKGSIVTPTESEESLWDRPLFPLESRALALPREGVQLNFEQKLVLCDANYKFDVFCGEASGKSSSSPHFNESTQAEIWIDTSSSMKDVDPVVKNDDTAEECQRSKLVKNFFSACSAVGNLSFKTFDTSLREASVGGASLSSSFCLNRGLNDYKELIKKIEASTAKHLLIVTDVYELQMEFSRYLEGKQAKIYGGSGVFQGAQLETASQEWLKNCSKN